MLDKLDAEIERAEKEYWEAEERAAKAARLRDIAEARLDALRLAAELRPQAPSTRPTITSAPPVPAAGGKGRQPGAISKIWRHILIQMSESYPKGVGETEITEMAKGAGLLNIRSKDVRARMSDYLAHDYVEQGPEGWRVTQIAISRFKDGSLVSSTEQSDEDTADSEESAVEPFRADSVSKLPDLARDPEPKQEGE